MAKQKKNTLAPNRPPLQLKKPVPLWEQKPILLAILVILALIFYGNTLLNEYSLDDVISITMNSFTKKGFAGIPDLLNKDSFTGFIGNASDLSGGRWRPLALVTFATEIQFFGQNPTVSHIDNLLLFVLITVVMFQLLSRYIFRTSIFTAFIATLLFVIHPIHTEVVANIKSRDELLSFLFLLLTLYLSFQYMLEGKKFWKLALSLLCYFLALLSKENGMTFIAILPLSIYFFTREKNNKIASTTFLFFIVAALYIILRLAVIGFKHKAIDEVMNAPYLYASFGQALATKLLVLGKYIILLFYPNPLTYDYSYHQIPYVNFSDWGVWLSIIVQLGLLTYAILKFKERNIFAYGILFYFFSIFIVSNLVVDTGGVMGERFLFQPSFGFCICIAALANIVFTKLSFGGNINVSIAAGLLIIIICLGGYKTISRNMDWKNDRVLFIKDVRTSPNSARTQNGAGTSFIYLSDDAKDTVLKRQLIDSSITHLRIALKLHPKYVDPWLNLGVAYNRLGDTYKAEEMWDSARARNPKHPKLGEFDNVLAVTFYNAALKDGAVKNYSRCINEFYHSIRYNPKSADTWYNLGGAYFTISRLDSARICFSKALELDPKNQGAANGLNALRVQGR